MSHAAYDPKGACNTCALDSAPCPGSAVAPSAANGIDLPQFN